MRNDSLHALIDSLHVLFLKKDSLIQENKKLAEKEIKLAKAEKENADLRAEKHSYISSFAITITILVCLALVFVYRKARIIKRQKNLLEISEQTLKNNAEELKTQAEELRTQKEYTEEQNKKLETLQKAKDKQASQIVHDFQNPLQQIIAHSVEKESQVEVSAPIFQKDLKIIHKAALRIHRLKQSILDIQKLENAEDVSKILDLKNNNLHKMADEALGYFDSATIQRQIQIKNQIPQDLHAQCDKDKIERVLDNLLGNAVKHTSDQGEIEISSETRDQHIEVSVFNTGKSIPPEQQRKIFDSFTSFDGSTGLGLAFCQLTIEAHQQKIWVESEEGKGTRFTFSLLKDEESPTESIIETLTKLESVEISRPSLSTSAQEFIKQNGIKQLRTYGCHEAGEIENILEELEHQLSTSMLAQIDKQAIIVWHQDIIQAVDNLDTHTYKLLLNEITK